MIAEIIFWSCTALLVYAYLLYPAIVFIAAGIRPVTKQLFAPTAHFPQVSVLVAAYNEEKVIEKKIGSLLNSEYPPALTEIIIGSDAADDSTDEIILNYAASDIRLKLIRSEARIGKAGMLNKLSASASGDILIITDANVILSHDTINRLVSVLTDQRIGLCDATARNTGTYNEGVRQQENLYTRYESSLKRAEGNAWGTMTGPYGGCYAIRRELFPVLPENILVDDLFVGLTVLRKGFLAVNCPDAIVTEDTLADIGSQYRRRVRIAAGSFQNLFHFGLFPGKSIMASLSFFSHKVLRWSTPLAMVLIFLTTVILSGHSVLYFCLLAVQLIFILLTALDFALGRMKIALGPMRFMTQFMLMNVALAEGFVRALTGIKSGIWQPTKRE